ncbi:MAG TPA: 2-C-methyl-D-erythritol 4-phosphate cytidylyltransferase [Candidatus Baltobacteraceae bacterium]|jgi:2-C-methyl-D-erythritol 4-phosphate cytidylyltransferase|nr:2-C-methyl-D-erythritol 4-phosphate cytidylyltransferase [Candidatus Baltobacteraceae bacterium]
MRLAAIVVAAGRGERFGQAKQFAPLAGRPMLSWSLEVLASLSEVVSFVIAAEAEHVENVLGIAREVGLLTEDVPRSGAKQVRVVVGGATRQESVRRALDAVDPTHDAVMVHDAARPLVRREDVRRAIELVGPSRAALLAAPVSDTLKEIAPDGSVLRTLDRSRLWAAQTPQLALLADLRKAHAVAHRDGYQGTDEAELLERIGVSVNVVSSSNENFKVTFPDDLLRAEALLVRRFEETPR